MFKGLGVRRVDSIRQGKKVEYRLTHSVKKISGWGCVFFFFVQVKLIGSTPILLGLHLIVKQPILE